MSNKIKNFEFGKPDFGFPGYYTSDTDTSPMQRTIEVFPESRELYAALSHKGDSCGITLSFSKKAWKQLGEIILGEFEDE